MRSMFYFVFYTVSRKKGGKLLGMEDDKLFES